MTHLQMIQNINGLMVQFVFFSRHGPLQTKPAGHFEGEGRPRGRLRLPGHRERSGTGRDLADGGQRVVVRREVRRHLVKQVGHPERRQ